MSDLSPLLLPVWLLANWIGIRCMGLLVDRVAAFIVTVPDAIIVYDAMLKAREGEVSE